MAKILVTCPQGHRLQMSADYNGKQVRCPKCHQVFAVAVQETQSNRTAMQETLPTDLFGDIPLPDINTTGRYVPTSPMKSTPKKLPNQRKNFNLMIPAAIGVACVALLGLIGVLFWLGSKPGPLEQGQDALANANSSSVADNTSTKIESTKRTQGMDSEVRYPRLPGAVPAIPEWVAKIAPFDASDFVNSIPWEQNAAPLYLEALIEFTSETAVCFPLDQQEELSKVSKTRGKALNDFMAKWGNDFDLFTAARSANDNIELDKLLSAYELGFAKVATAQKRTFCCFESGVSISSQIPHPQAMRSVSRIQGYRALRQVDRNDLDGAISTLGSMLRASRDLRPRGHAISQLVSVALDRLALTSIAPLVLNSDRCTDRHCDRLLKVIQEHRTLAKESMSALTQLEYTMMILVMDQVQHRSGDFAPENIKKMMKEFGFKSVGETPGHLLQIITGIGDGAEDENRRAVDSINARLDLMSPEEYEKEKRAIGSWYTATITMSSLPFVQQRPALEKIAADCKKSFFLSLLTPPSSLITLDGFSANIAEIHGTLCLVALKRWQLEGKTEPAELSAIMKRVGIPSVPIDPFSGEPMKLTMVSGRPVIYSVGKDRIDDMGQVDWRTGKVPGDILFKLQ